jgi:hypothetical protein
MGSRAQGSASAVRQNERRVEMNSHDIYISLILALVVLVLPGIVIWMDDANWDRIHKH